MIPKDPVMLLSYINTQLRDFYDSYEDLCKSLDLDQNEVKQKLSMIVYRLAKEHVDCRRKVEPHAFVEFPGALL